VAVTARKSSGRGHPIAAARTAGRSDAGTLLLVTKRSRCASASEALRRDGVDDRVRYGTVNDCFFASDARFRNLP
jgi:hypothetical protein